MDEIYKAVVQKAMDRVLFGFVFPIAYIPVETMYEMKKLAALEKHDGHVGLVFKINSIKEEHLIFTIVSSVIATMNKLNLINVKKIEKIACERVVSKEETVEVFVVGMKPSVDKDN